MFKNIRAAKNKKNWKIPLEIAYQRKIYNKILIFALSLSFSFISHWHSENFCFSQNYDDLFVYKFVGDFSLLEEFFLWGVPTDNKGKISVGLFDVSS